MINDFLGWEEQQALEAICRFHGADDPDLVKHLATFCNWTRADEAAKGRLDRGGKPPFLIVLLSQMGIHGADALAPTPKDTP